MMSKEKALQNNPEFFYGYHIVAFLDLLGQKNHLIKIEGILDSSDLEPHNERLQKTLRNTIGTIWNFRKIFLQYFDQYINHLPSNPIPKDFENHFNQMRGHSHVNFQSFSDSTIIWTPVLLKNEFNYAQVLNSVHGILISIGIITPYFLSVKTPIRGGIELEGGILITPEGNEIYGPALNRAYSLECKEAEYPRVLLGNKLVDFLTRMKTHQFHDIQIQNYCHAMAERCMSWISIDEDHKSMIHFLGPANKELMLGSPAGKSYFNDVLNPIDSYIRECEVNFHNDKKLKPRYERLRKYFDKYIGDWNE